MRLGKTMARKPFGGLQSLGASGARQAGVELVGPDAGAAENDEITRRAAFVFAPAQAECLTIHAALAAAQTMDASPNVLFGEASSMSPRARLHGGVWEVEWRSNPTDRRNWMYAANWAARRRAVVARPREKLEVWAGSVRASGKDCCHVVRADPYLAAAEQRTWAKGLPRMSFAHWGFVMCALAVALLVTPVLQAIGSRTIFFPSGVWVVIALASSAERFSTTRLQLYSQTNRIVWHIESGIRVRS